MQKGTAGRTLLVTFSPSLRSCEVRLRFGRARTSSALRSPCTNFQAAKVLYIFRNQIFRQLFSKSFQQIEEKCLEGGFSFPKRMQKGTAGRAPILKPFLWSQRKGFTKRNDHYAWSAKRRPCAKSSSALTRYVGRHPTSQPTRLLTHVWLTRAGIGVRHAVKPHSGSVAYVEAKQRGRRQ